MLLVALQFGSLPVAYGQDTSPGSLDPLNALVAGAGAGSTVFATAVQPDGKTILAGRFTSVLGVARGNIARLNADGTLDPVFNPNANGDIQSLAVQADGKIIVGGYFSGLQPNGAGTLTGRNRIARLNADGTVDPGFNPNANEVVAGLALQADGKIVVGGYFSGFQPNGAGTLTVRNRIARLNPDGTVDPGFNPNANEVISGVAVQADGKMVVVGYFTSFQPNGAATPTTRNRVARLNPDGTLDLGFDPNANDPIRSVAVQADGKILVGGNFTALRPNGAATPTTRNRIARLNTDGSLDPIFNPNADSWVVSTMVQADGKILMGGNFYNLQPNGAATPTQRKRIARLNADGTVDGPFNPNPDTWVRSLAQQADGKALLGGEFTTLQPNGAVTATTRQYFARLNSDTATQSLTIANPTQVLWSRGGAAPDVSQVTVELSVNPTWRTGG